MEMCPQCGQFVDELPWTDDAGDKVCSWNCVLINRRAKEKAPRIPRPAPLGPRYFPTPETQNED